MSKLGLLTVLLSVCVVGCGLTVPGPDRPPNPPSVTMVRISDPATQIARVVVSGEDTFSLLAQKNSSGKVQKIVGATYYKADIGQTVTVWLDDDGLPAFMVAGGWYFGFSNYTGSTVDITARGPDGTNLAQKGIAVPTDAQNYLGLLRQSRTSKTGQSSKIGDPGFWGLVETASYGFGAGVCIGASFLAIATPEPITTAGGLALLATCAGPVITSAGIITGNEDIQDLGTVASLASCIGPGTLECGVAAAGGVASVAQGLEVDEATLYQQQQIGRAHV